LRVTSKVKEIDFGSITRALDDGTETAYMLKITDQFGSEFRFLLGETENYHREVEEEAAEYFHQFTDAVGYEID
jgi:hypothetical protein